MKESIKHDKGKPRYDLFPMEALEIICKVLEMGAEKYGENNWRQGMKWSRFIRAGIGHRADWVNHTKSDKDHESGLSHLAHSICCDIMLLVYEKNKLGIDDRYKFKK